MKTKTSKSASMRKVFTLMGMALPLALMLGLALAALVLLLPVTVSASAQAPGDNSIGKVLGKVCGDTEPQLYLSKPKAAKPDGEKQPLDLSVDLTDENGNPITGAKVRARVTDFETFVDAYLTDMGNGRYTSCAFGYFNGSGSGEEAVRIHIRAEKVDYTSGTSDGSSSAGRLCSVSLTSSASSR